MADDEEETAEEACYRHVVAGEADLKASKREKNIQHKDFLTRRALAHLDFARWYDHMAFMGTLDGAEDA